MWDKIVIFAADNKRKEEYECSINELWTYLQGLSLTADNWQWLAERAKEKSNTSAQVTSKPKEVKYKISPRRRKLMEKATFNPKDFEGDERAQYILSK